MYSNVANICQIFTISPNNMHIKLAICNPWSFANVPLKPINSICDSYSLNVVNIGSPVCGIVWGDCGAFSEGVGCGLTAQTRLLSTLCLLNTDGLWLVGLLIWPPDLSCLWPCFPLYNGLCLPRTTSQNTFFPSTAFTDEKIRKWPGLKLIVIAEL